MRPWWSPSVPGISWFLETNVRTYVRHRSGLTGVWFFSPDASSRIAVAVARGFWHLPYYHAHMSLNVATVDSGRVAVEYESRRSGREDGTCFVRGDWVAESAERSASAGTLEEFLVERYVLFCRTPRGAMRIGRVHHRPYAYRDLAVRECRQTLTDRAGIVPPAGALPDHAVISSGVNVSIGALRATEQSVSLVDEINGGRFAAASS